MDLKVTLKIEGLEGIAESIKILAGAVGSPGIIADPIEAVAVKVEKVEKEPVKEEKKESSALTLTDVKKALHSLVQDGKETQVAELLKSFNAAKLSDVAEDDYAAVIEKAKAL